MEEKEGLQKIFDYRKVTSAASIKMSLKRLRNLNTLPSFKFYSKDVSISETDMFIEKNQFRQPKIPVFDSATFV